MPEGRLRGRPVPEKATWADTDDPWACCRRMDSARPRFRSFTSLPLFTINMHCTTWG